MTILKLYDKKDTKKITDKFREIDLSDLESFGHFEPSQAFLDIPSKIIDKKSILKWFSYNDISYWWFIAPVILPIFNNATMFIDRLNSYILQYSITKIILKGNFAYTEIINQICKNNNLQFEISNTKHFFSFQEKIKNSLKKNRYKKITKIKHKQRLQCYRERIRNSTIHPKSIIFTSPGVYRRPSFENTTGKVVDQEFFIQPLLDLLKEKNVPTLCIDLDYTFHGQKNKLQGRLSSKFNWIPVEYLLNEPKSKKTKSIIKNLDLSIKKLSSFELSTVFSHNQISLSSIILPLLKEIFFEPYLPTFIHLIEEAKKFFIQIKPRALIQIYEVGPYAKAFEIAAQHQGIKTLSIQHGLIHEKSLDYMHKEIKSPENPLGNPLSDVTCVYGKYYEKILTEKGHYPQNKVKVIGNPVFYDLNSTKQILSSYNLREKYQLPNKKIILIPLTFKVFLGSLNNPDYNLLEIIHDNFHNDDSIIFLVRPHPTDQGNAKNFLKKHFPKINFKISKFSLFEDLYLCDAVVTTLSTVSIDATIFEKPVLIANLTNNVPSVDAHHKIMEEYKVAILCSKNELINQIKSLEKGQLWKNTQFVERKIFIDLFFHTTKRPDLLKMILSDN